MVNCPSYCVSAPSTGTSEALIASLGADEPWSAVTMIVLASIKLTPLASTTTVLICPAPCTTESVAGENMGAAVPSVLVPVGTSATVSYHQSSCTSASIADTATVGGTTYPVPAEVSAMVLMVP